MVPKKQMDASPSKKSSKQLIKRPRSTSSNPIELVTKVKLIVSISLKRVISGLLVKFREIDGTLLLKCFNFNNRKEVLIPN